MTEGQKDLASNLTSQNHLHEILNGRNQQLPGLSYKLQGGSYGLDVAFSDALDIDEKRMSLRIPFADGNHRDGVGDLLEVAGILVDRHRANPIVLFDHGKQVALPIGLAEDPETKHYTVRIDPIAKSADLVAFFYQGKSGEDGVDYGSSDYDHAVFCEQLFDLAAKRYIRAGSIGYQVVQAYELPPEPVVGTPKGLHLQKVLMLEGSLVVMPANQDTVRKALSLPNVCGKPLSPMLVKSLSAYAPERKAQLGYEGRKGFNQGDHVEIADGEYAGRTGVVFGNPLPQHGAVGTPRGRFGETQIRVQIDGFPKPGGWDGKVAVRESWLRKKDLEKSQPSADIDPDKARQILRDGEVHGEPLTDKQRGMFAAAANKGQKSRLMTVCRSSDGWYVCNVGSNSPEFGPFVSQGIAEAWARRLNMGKSINDVRKKYKRIKKLRQNRTKNTVRKLKKSRQELRDPASTNVHAGTAQAGETVIARRMLVRIPPPPERPTPMNFASSGDRLEVVDASHSRMKVRRQDGETMWVTSNDVRRVKAMEKKAFCPTGDGGGVDPTCGSDKPSQNKPSDGLSRAQAKETANVRRFVERLGYDPDNLTADQLQHAAREYGKQEFTYYTPDKFREVVSRKSIKGTKSMKDMDETTPDQATEDGGYNMHEPLGAQVLRRFHEDASLLLQDYDEMLGPLENERVKARLQAKAESLAEELEEAEELFGKEYPDLGGLVGMKDDDALEEAADLETDGDPDTSKEEYEEELEPTPKDMDTIDDSGIAASSEPKEEPTPDEAVEGMERAEEEEENPVNHKKIKTLRKKYSKKSIKGRKIAPAIAAVARTAAPMVAQAVGSALSDRDKGYVKEAGGFLEELGQPESMLGDEGRMKSYHYHKTLEGMSQLEEAHDDLEQVPPETDVPPAEFEPGPGAKGIKADPGTEEWQQEEMREPEHQDENVLVGTSKYFKELCTCGDDQFGDEHRGKCMTYSKQLKDFVGGDEPVEEEPTEEVPTEDVPTEEVPPNDVPEGVVMEEDAPQEEEEPGMEVKFLAEEASLQNKKIAELTRMLSRLPI